MTNQSGSANARRPYESPEVLDLGTVAAVTQTATMTGVAKDGGPNNIKS